MVAEGKGVVQSASGERGVRFPPNLRVRGASDAERREQLEHRNLFGDARSQTLKISTVILKTWTVNLKTSTVKSDPESAGFGGGGHLF